MMHLELLIRKEKTRMNRDELMLLIHKAFDERMAIEEEIEE